LLQLFADIIAAILNFLRPIVSPMGQFMVLWMDFVLQFFPDGLLTYIMIAAIIVVLGIIVNTIWPGDKPPKYLDKFKGKAIEKEEKVKIKKPKIVKEEKKEKQKVEKPLEEEIETQITEKVEEPEAIEDQLEIEEIKGGETEELKEEVKPEKIDEKELKVEEEKGFKEEEIEEKIELEKEIKETPAEKIEQTVIQEEEDETESRVKAWLNQVKKYRK
jgi:hypothetical protein